SAHSDWLCHLNFHQMIARTRQVQIPQSWETLNSYIVVQPHRPNYFLCWTRHCPSICYPSVSNLRQHPHKKPSRHALENTASSYHHARKLRDEVYLPRICTSARA